MTTADSARYRWPDGPYRMVRIGCTGRGTHRVEKFGTARVWPDGTIDLRLTDDPERIGTGQPRWDVDPDEGILMSSRFPHIALRCRQCRRTPRVQILALSTALVGLADLGRDRLDLSALHS